MAAIASDTTGMQGIAALLSRGGGQSASGSGPAPNNGTATPGAGMGADLQQQQQVQMAMQIREIGQKVQAIAATNPMLTQISTQIQELLRQMLIMSAQATPMQTMSGQAVPGGGGGQ